MRTEVLAWDGKHVWIQQTSDGSRENRELVIPCDVVLRFAKGAPGTIVRVDGLGESARIHVSDHRPMSAGSLLTDGDVWRFQTAGPAPHRRVKADALAVVEPSPEPAPARTGLEGLHRDLEVARVAGLKVERKIRAHIVSAEADGDIEICQFGGDPHRIAPLVWAVREVSSGNETTVYYLTEEARRIIVLRLKTQTAKKLQKAVNERAAKPTQAPTGFDVQALGAVIAASLAPILERLLPSAHAAPQLPPGSVVVPAPPAGYELTQARVARRLGLPEDGPGANLVGTWARKLRMYGVAPWSTWIHGVHGGRLHEDAQVMYSPDIVEDLRPMAEAALSEMAACGHRIVKGKLSPFGVSPTTTVECARRMREAMATKQEARAK